MFPFQIDYPSRASRVQGIGGRLRDRAFVIGLSMTSLLPGSASAGGDTGPSAGSKADGATGKGPAAARPVTTGERTTSRVAMKPSATTSARPAASLSAANAGKMEAGVSPIAEALRVISGCKARFQSIDDYSCDFYKRERINGRLTGMHVMSMKERTKPKSIYFKFQAPNRGREAIYVDGRNGGRVVAHDVGFTKFLAGTMELDPTGARAMENNRHPITEAGIGELIETVEERWLKELDPGHSVINHHRDLQVGPHSSVTMIESIHPRRNPDFLFHKVRLYIVQEHGLPIRFEAYDWPEDPQSAPKLVEEYTYLNLKVNMGLKDSDFDPANEEYSFGRF